MPSMLDELDESSASVKIKIKKKKKKKNAGKTATTTPFGKIPTDESKSTMQIGDLDVTKSSGIFGHLERRTEDQISSVVDETAQQASLMMDSRVSKSIKRQSKM